MRYLTTLLVIILLFSLPSKGQHYIFRYNPYSGMNRDQLELSLEQARKMERNGKISTVVGAGLLVTGSLITFNSLNRISYEENFNSGGFGAGLGIMCLGAFPLGYGMVAWIAGRERANMIEVELLAFESVKLKLRPAENGLGLVMVF